MRTLIQNVPRVQPASQHSEIKSRGMSTRRVRDSSINHLSGIALGWLVSWLSLSLCGYVCQFAPRVRMMILHVPAPSLLCCAQIMCKNKASWWGTQRKNMITFVLIKPLPPRMTRAPVQEAIISSHVAHMHDDDYEETVWKNGPLLWSAANKIAQQYRPTCPIINNSLFPAISSASLRTIYILVLWTQYNIMWFQFVLSHCHSIGTRHRRRGPRDH